MFQLVTRTGRRILSIGTCSPGAIGSRGVRIQAVEALRAEG
jgi:hypothetical protein